MLSQDEIEKARQVDVLALASRHTTLKRVAATGGGEFAGPCPLCGGRDRFHVQPETNRWFCRFCTGSPEQDGWKDVIELHMRLSGEPFQQAVQSLNQGAAITTPQRPVQARQETKSANPPGEKWQQRGQAVIERAMEHLWGKAGAREMKFQEKNPVSGEIRFRCLSPLDWLLARGLEPDTLKAARIGYIPQKWEDNPASWGLEGGLMAIAHGILIPAQVNGALWSLKIRRPVGEPKFTQVRGGKPALYLAETLLSAPEAACIVEGEFDALLLRQCLRHAANSRWRNLGVITLGSNSNDPALEHWARYLYPVKSFLLLYDQDGKSQRAIRFWESLSARTRQVSWSNLRPHDKDLTDYHLSGGRLLDLVSWAVMQTEYESLSRQAATPARQASQAPALLFEPAKAPDETPRVIEPLAQASQRRVVIQSIEEAAEYIRKNGLRVKSVTWPKGEPRPIVKLE